MIPLNKLKIYGIGKIGPKGQVVIPSEARRELSLDPGERVVVMNMPHGQAMLVMNETVFNQHLDHLRGHFGNFNDVMSEYKKHRRDSDCDD